MSPREQHLESLATDVATAAAESFNAHWRAWPRQGAPEARARALDQMAARFAGVAQSFNILAERCSDAAAALLDSTED